MSYLPPEIAVESAGNDVTYDLPVRPIGKIRWVAIIPLAFGLLFISMPLKQEWRFLQDFVNGKGSSANLFEALFFIPFLVGGFIPIGLGLMLMFGRCRIRWQNSRLTVYERVGPFFWSRKFSNESIRKLKVSIGSTSNGEPVTSGPLATMGSIMAEMDKRKRIVVAFYPSQWLHPLAQDLSRRMAAFSAGEAPKVEFVDIKQPEHMPEIVQKPVNSLVQVEKRSDGLKMVIPAPGFVKESRAMLFMGIFWCALMTAFTVAFVFALRKNTPDLMVWFFLVAFWLVGIGLLTGALNKSRQHASITVQDGNLKMIQTGLFGTKQWEWQLQDLKAICSDRSGVVINERPMFELQFQPKAGKKVGLLGGRDEEELSWMAFELRQATGLPAKT